MEKIKIAEILACPKCKNPISPKKRNLKCNKGGFLANFENNIWKLLFIPNKKTRFSRKKYEIAHKKAFYGPSDGSYEILANFAKGTKAVDIACGEGLIEKFNPEIVAVEFSENALKKAKVNGAKYLVLADTHSLPFRDNSFDIAISTGNLEHFENPKKAIKEMARISKIQILIVHRHPPIPFGNLLFDLSSKIFNIKHQPIEKPISAKTLEKMMSNAKLKIIYKGVWTLPVNYGRVIKFLPEFKNIPCCTFVISIKK